MYICIYVYMYICIYVYMYICIYVYMYICIYVYMYIWVHSCRVSAEQCNTVLVCAARSKVSLLFCLAVRGKRVHDCCRASCLTPTHALYAPREVGRGGWRTPKETAHMAAVQTHVRDEHARHVLRSAVRHCACSALCSLVPCQRGAVQHCASVCSTL